MIQRQAELQQQRQVYLDQQRQYARNNGQSYYGPPQGYPQGYGGQRQSRFGGGGLGAGLLGGAALGGIGGLLIGEELG